MIQAALAREKQSTTAVGNEVAIPHAQVAGVATPTVLFARIPDDGVDWNSPDDKSVRFVFLIAVPEGANKKHMKILAQLARALMREISALASATRPRALRLSTLFGRPWETYKHLTVRSDPVLFH